MSKVDLYEQRLTETVAEPSIPEPPAEPEFAGGEPPFPGPQEEVKDEWAIVELMGHVKLAGRLTEEEKFGTKMGRLDIPEGEGFVTQYFGGGSVYRITYVTEEVARHVMQRNAAAPVKPWDFPRQLTNNPVSDNDDFDDPSDQF